MQYIPSCQNVPPAGVAWVFPGHGDEGGCALFSFPLLFPSASPTPQVKSDADGRILLEKGECIPGLTADYTPSRRMGAAVPIHHHHHHHHPPHTSTSTDPSIASYHCTYAKVSTRRTNTGYCLHNMSV
ncbi:hypothetical protein L209DRAFT_760165 [Thermothelomyces heterothallicus CBS 203.75]